MHPDLSPHLHSKECNVLISQLKSCHEENKFQKFLGVCNDLDRKVIKCLHEERVARRAANILKSRERQRIVREKIRQENVQ